ncbi:MAG: transglutaminase domain protein, partial [Frankiales bacterium]|nr:transglutaminase domain protein [Frankiales bacterium]
MTTVELLPPVVEDDLEEVVVDAGPNPTLVAATALLATAAVGWMLGGIFDGPMARALGLLASCVGVGLVWASTRTSRPGLLQYAVPVVGGLLGTAAALTGPGQGNVLRRVEDAIRQGGLGDPPVPFDGGWRLLLVLVLTVLGGAALTAALAFRRPRLALLLPVPLVFLGSLMQPDGQTLPSSVGSLVLLLAAFGAAYSVDLARDGAGDGRFELRRAFRGAGVLLLLVAALIGLSRTGFLLPEQTEQAVIPPQFPQQPPPAPAGILFSIDTPQVTPVRLGVLDVYRVDSWLTPPFDTKRFVGLSSGEQIQSGAARGEAPVVKVGAGALRSTVTMGTLGGRNLPDVANPQSVLHNGLELQYDPRTQALRLPKGIASAGTSYTVTSAPIPTGKQLAAAGAPGPAVSEYLDVPAAPPAVQALLAKAPTKDRFDRLQYLRNAFYRQVIASGSGNPVPVPPARVDAMLAGKPATPFEIVAAEGLLARWAGVPSRIGYGYYSRTPKAPGGRVYDITAADGAVWLEAYFEGQGWVPIVGTPPRAQASLDTKPKKKDPTIRPSDRLSLVVYVPVQLTGVQLLFTLLQYWVLRLLPVVLGLLGLLAFYPALLKSVRRFVRRRWAASCGPREVLASAYAELRDQATDLNIGSPVMTPLEFLDVVADDPEHVELAWLVTRALWGDLTRDLGADEAELASDMADSVRRRMRQASVAGNRVVALAARASLKDPYTREIPNTWFGPRRRRATRRLVPRRVLTAGPALLMVLLVLTGCSRSNGVAHVNALPTRLVPAGATAGVTFVREQKAEAAFKRAGSRSLVGEARVWTLRIGSVAHGDLQVVAFKQGFSAKTRSVRRGVIDAIGGRSFELQRFGTRTLYVANLPSQQLLLWFAPD